MTGVIESLEARIRVLEDRVSLLEGRGQPPRPGELCAPVVFVDALGAARTRPEDCRDGVSYIQHGGRTYWPLSDQDNRRLLRACCGHGEFDGPQEAEPVAWLYTLEYGSSVANKKVSLSRLRYPFGIVGVDYCAKNDDGVSYVRETSLHPPKPAAQPLVPEGMLRVELAMSDRSISRLIPVVQIETSNTNEVERYANQCWRELSAAKEEGK